MPKRWVSEELRGVIVFVGDSVGIAVLLADGGEFAGSGHLERLGFASRRGRLREQASSGGQTVDVRLVSRSVVDRERLPGQRNGFDVGLIRRAVGGGLGCRICDSVSSDA